MQKIYTREETGIDLKSIGQKIKQTRLLRKKTQQEIADECGISKSLLSRIENGHKATALATLSKISDSLDVPLSWLLDNQNGVNPLIVRESDRKSEIGDIIMGYSFELLANKTNLSLIQPMIVHVPKVQKKNQQTYTHSQDEFIYILEGAIELLYDGKKYYMKKGDSAYFEGTKSHLFMPADNEEAKVLTIYIENPFHTK